MPLLLAGAVLALALWLGLTFLFPLGPSASAIHLLLGVAAVLFIRWYALRYQR